MTLDNMISLIKNVSAWKLSILPERSMLDVPVIMWMLRQCRGRLANGIMTCHPNLAHYMKKAIDLLSASADIFFLNPDILPYKML